MYDNYIRRYKRAYNYLDRERWWRRDFIVFLQYSWKYYFYQPSTIFIDE